MMQRQRVLPDGSEEYVYGSRAGAVAFAVLGAGVVALAVGMAVAVGEAWITIAAVAGLAMILRSVRSLRDGLPSVLLSPAGVTYSERGSVMLQCAWGDFGEIRTVGLAESLSSPQLIRLMQAAPGPGAGGPVLVVPDGLGLDRLLSSGRTRCGGDPRPASSGGSVFASTYASDAQQAPSAHGWRHDRAPQPSARTDGEAMEGTRLSCMTRITYGAVACAIAIGALVEEVPLGDPEAVLAGQVIGLAVIALGGWQIRDGVERLTKGLPVLYLSEHGIEYWRAGRMQFTHPWSEVHHVKRRESKHFTGLHFTCSAPDGATGTVTHSVSSNNIGNPRDVERRVAYWRRMFHERQQLPPPQAAA